MPSTRGADLHAVTGLPPVPAKTVAAPRVDECIGHFACRFETEQRFGTPAMVFGRIQAVSLEKRFSGAGLGARCTAFRPTFSREEVTFATLGPLRLLD